MAQQTKVRWFNAALNALGLGQNYAEQVDREGFSGAESLTLSSLMGNGVTGARSRQQIYQKYQQMLTDPVIAGAIRIHVTAALGGHETTGAMVFIEPSASARDDKTQKKMVEEIAVDVAPLINRVIVQVAYNALGYGDGFGRLYTKKRKGVVDICADEMMLPPLVQAYEVANRTVVCELAIGQKGREKLVMNQIARMKMPRLIYTPQPLAIEKAWRTRVKEDDVDMLPVMPSLVGGSMLADAESQWDNFMAALQGLVGQRVLDSIDESIFTVQTQGMTKEQRQELMKSIKQVLERSKKVADDAVRTGRPFLGRIRHVLPVWTDKQLVQVQGVNSGGGGGGRAGNISIEDVLFHAKLLCGALGTDLTMLGFADMMSGGLGDGGFMRTSVQAAERSKSIREAASEFINHIITIHCVYKYGVHFEPNERPWKVNFYGTIAAMETERQKTALDSASTALVILQMLDQAKNAGLSEKSLAHFLTTVAKMDEDDASMYAADVVKAKEDESAAGGGGGGFGG